MESLISSYFPYVISFVLGIVSIVLLYKYSAKKQQYWKEKGIPYVEPIPFIGSIFDNIKKPLHENELERYQKLGRVYGYYEGNSPALTIGDPDIVKNILIKDFFKFSGRRKIETGDPIFESMMQMLHGEDWKRVRTIVTPTFTTGKIKRMMSIYKECSKKLVKNFEKAKETEDPVQIMKLYQTFALDIIASAAFSTKLDSYNDTSSEFVKQVASISGELNWRFVIFLLCPRVMQLFKVKIFPQDRLKFFYDLTMKIIEERKKLGQTRNDFLQLLLDTVEGLVEEDQETTGKGNDILSNYGKDDVSEKLFKSTGSKRTLSFNELVAQCVIFFFAGRETTSTALSLISYLLALNEDVQDKLIAEIDSAVEECEGELTYEAVQNMNYLDNVISEAIRIFPPAIRLERVADEDYKLESHNITIPKGMIINIPTYAMHRDDAFYPNPEKFDPDRFTNEEKSKRSPYAYLPFGAGPRNCVGMRFALMEIKVCIAHMLSHYRFKKSDKTKVPLDFHIGQGLLQPKGIYLHVEKR